jgi:hypothetical protein
MKQLRCNNGSLLEELRRKNSACPCWHQCQHGDFGLLWHEDLETCEILASLVETDNVTRLHKTCRKFCEQNVPRPGKYKTCCKFSFCVQVLFPVRIGLTCHFLVWVRDDGRTALLTQCPLWHGIQIAPPQCL